MREWPELLAAIPRDDCGRIRVIEPPIPVRPDIFARDADLFGSFVKALAGTANAELLTIQPPKIEPALYFGATPQHPSAALIIRVREDRKLDVELGEGVTMTAAARLFIDELRRMLGA